ncbi:MAG: hypothetical protein HWN67_03395 [Candidatus Helarchaeota archaeon]|nr:hypothetical protein [Candidatus Helarchaeota archaeon]
MLIIDTCSWLKIRYLEESGVLRIKDLIYESDLWTTHELAKEYEYYLKDYLDLKRFSIQSLKFQKLEKFIDKELDPADLSIIEFGRKNDKALIISDDGAELVILNLFHLKAFQLSEFILFLVNQNILKKTEAINSIKHLRKWRNIKEKKKKKLLREINLIS